MSSGGATFRQPARRAWAAVRAAGAHPAADVLPGGAPGRVPPDVAGPARAARRVGAARRDAVTTAGARVAAAHPPRPGTHCRVPVRHANAGNLL